MSRILMLWTTWKLIVNVMYFDAVDNKDTDSQCHVFLGCVQRIWIINALYFDDVENKDRDIQCHII